MLAEAELHGGSTGKQEAVNTMGMDRHKCFGCGQVGHQVPHQWVWEA